MVDPDRVRRLLVLLQHHRNELAVPTDDVYRRRYLVQTAAQICIDVAQHVIASEGLRPPADYGDAFRSLAEHHVIDDGLADRLVALSGARNVIAHLYAEVDDDRLATSIREGGLDDLDAFARAVARLTASGD